MDLKNALCQIIPFWRYWPRLVAQWQNMLPTQNGQGFALLWNENYTQDQTRERKKKKTSQKNWEDSCSTEKCQGSLTLNGERTQVLKSRQQPSSKILADTEKSRHSKDSQRSTLHSKRTKDTSILEILPHTEVLSLSSKMRVTSLFHS